MCTLKKFSSAQHILHMHIKSKTYLCSCSGCIFTAKIRKHFQQRQQSSSTTTNTTATTAAAAKRIHKIKTVRKRASVNFRCFLPLGFHFGFAATAPSFLLHIIFFALVLFLPWWPFFMLPLIFVCSLCKMCNTSYLCNVQKGNRMNWMRIIFFFFVNKWRWGALKTRRRFNSKIRCWWGAWMYGAQEINRQ